MCSEVPVQVQKVYNHHPQFPAKEDFFCSLRRGVESSPSSFFLIGAPLR